MTRVFKIRAKKYLGLLIPECCIGLLAAGFLERNAEDFAQMASVTVPWTTGDLILYYFAGNLPLSVTGENTVFHIPVYWFIFLVWLAAYTCITYSQEYRNVMAGQITRYKDRGRWFCHLAKEVCSHTFLYILTILVLFLLVGIFRGHASLVIHNEFLSLMMQAEYPGESLTNFFPVYCGMLFFLVFTAGMIQITVSVFWTAIIGFVFQVILLIITTLYMTDFFFLNATMLLRNEKVIAGGVSFLRSGSVAAIVLVSCCILGLLHVKKKDFV